MRGVLVSAALAALMSAGWCGAENGRELVADSFDAATGEWEGMYLEGRGSGGHYSIADGKLTLEAGEPESIFAAWHRRPVSGHFYAEVEFAEDDGSGLALMQEKSGRPDRENFTSMAVRRNREGKVVVYVRDRQDGADDVLDNTGALGRERYEEVLDNQYSAPFTATNKKMRIFRDGPAGFFHFYYAVKAKIHGEWAEGWMELAPSRDWGRPGQRYYVALYAASDAGAPARAVFDNVRVVEKPTEDEDDAETGFRAVRREYNWSGFFGEAVVVTFGPEFPYREEGRKFVFWSEANYVPAWHMSNQLLYSYEFVETWGGGQRGCHEPMSDRLLRWSAVDIVEGNEVRKVVRWRYVLCNPDYRVPCDEVGTQLPEVEETWTFYPDGTALRDIVYRAKLDCEWRNTNEVMELIAIAGSLTDPVEHLASPALTVLNLEGEADSYHPPRKLNPRTNEWDEVIMTAHFRDAPDAFCAFSNGREMLEACSSPRLGFDLSWHATDYRFCHWPVGKEPYREPDGVKTFASWPAQVCHTSLIGAGAWEGETWEDRYRVDGTGRRYREWIMLAGLNEPGDLDGLRAKTATWLYPGEVTVLAPGSRFEKVDYARREFVFTDTAGERRCEFRLDPTARSARVVNPVIRVCSWGNHPVHVTLDGRRLRRGEDYRAAVEGGDALVWVRAELTGPSTFVVADRPE